MLRDLTPVHVIIVLAVVVLLFGARRLPDMAKSVGQSMKIFRNEVKDLRTDEPPTPAATPATPTVVQNAVVPPVVVQAPAVPTPDRPEPTEGSAPPKV